MGVIQMALFAVCLVLFATKQASATQHMVGGSQGWDQSTDFTSWAKGQTFKVGDTLVFKYSSGLHSVLELGSKSEYDKCDTSNAANSMNGGNDMVKLDKVGTRFFACGTAGHCSGGMKLMINVVASDTVSTPSSSSSSSSPPSSSSSSSSSSSTPSSTSSSSTSSASVLVHSILSSILIFALACFI